MPTERSYGSEGDYLTLLMSSDEETKTVESEQATRRTILALVATGLSFGAAVLLKREVLYRGYGEDGYGEQGFGE